MLHLSKNNMKNTTGVAAFVDHSQNDTFELVDFGGFSAGIGLHTHSLRPANVPLASRDVFPIILPRPATPNLDLASKNLQKSMKNHQIPLYGHQWGWGRFSEIFENSCGALVSSCVGTLPRDSIFHSYALLGVFRRSVRQNLTILSETRVLGSLNP